MKYTYKFVDGFESAVEVSSELAAVLESLDEQEKNDNRRETRRHISSDILTEKGFGIWDVTQDIDFILESNEFHKQELWLEQLQRQVFRKHLTERQADVFYLHKVLHYNNSKIARQYGITEGAVRKLIGKAETTLYAVYMQIFDEPGITIEDINFEDTVILGRLLDV
jgi:DNA-directed RNA polymerase specialized sigma subunit